jgi:hypothetical protein
LISIRVVSVKVSVTDDLQGQIGGPIANRWHIIYRDMLCVI